MPSPVPSPVPAPIPKPPPPPIQQKIQIPRTGAKCPKLFTYNKTTKFCERCPDGTNQIGKKCVLLPTDDNKDVDDHTVVLPKPHNAPGNSLKDMIEGLQKSGEQIKDPFYNAGRYMVFVYIYLIKKYASPCLLYNNTEGNIYHGAVINYHIEKNQLQYSSTLAQSMLDCIVRGTDVIFITLYMGNAKTPGAHVNILIYRPFKRIVERYEPHGQQTGWGDDEYDEYKLNLKLKELFEQDVMGILGIYTPVFKTPYELCPMRQYGFQGIENLLPYDHAKENGYCQMWIMFMMETILLNPTLNTEHIIEECITIGKNDPTYFVEVIRGYTQQLTKELKLYLGDHVKDVNNIGTPRSKMVFMNINLNQVINETLQITSKIKNPMKKMGDIPEGSLPLVEVKFIEKQIDTLNTDQTYRYIKFIKDQHIFKVLVPMTTLGKYKQELKYLMLTRRLRWETLMANMFNYFFTMTPPLLLKRYKYFIRMGENPPEQLHCENVPINKNELMNEAKANYENFHVFFIIVQTNYDQKFKKLLAKDIKKIPKDVNALTSQDVSTLLYLIVFNNIATDEDKDKHKPIFNTNFNDEHKRQLQQLCTEKNLTIRHLQNLRSLF